MEKKDQSFSLCMYQVTGQGLKLLDNVRLAEESCYPRVDGHSQKVYIPGGLPSGVSVVSWEDNRLTPHPTLTCVDKCRSVGVMSKYTLCMCDTTNGNVSVVSVTDDTVTATLQKPEEVRNKNPSKTAVLGDSVLIWYEDKNLVVYNKGVSSLSTMVTWPEGLQSVYGMSSDGVSRFLVCDRNSNAVFILDVSGKLCDKINIDTVSPVAVVRDCTVVYRNVWVGCLNGDIVVMSPQ